MSIWQEFHGPNAGYLYDLYEKYQEDPSSVDARTRALFEQWQPDGDAASFVNGNGRSSAPIVAQPSAPAGANPDKVMGAVNLAQAIRQFGHLAAQLDPLGTTPDGDPTLSPEYHGISEADLRALPASLVGGPVSETAVNAYEAIQKLRTVYCGSTGYDYDHINNFEERQWLREAAESYRFRAPNAKFDPNWMLLRLTQVEGFEQFLHRVFPGKKRFSIEGVDMMVPIIETITIGAAEGGIRNILIGMAHRGRLNVLAHILRKPYSQMLAEFKDGIDDRMDSRSFLGYTGDVKYHSGAIREYDFDGDRVVDLAVKIAPNPSHLEHVNPVVAGMARAAGTFTDKPGHPRFDHKITIPIVVHGDAAFAGQGVVAETLNMYRLRGYRVGGTIHIIANNQVGFTTHDWAARSTRYASDLAKGFKFPIVHVNADDPEACIEVAWLAYHYRQTFQKDFLIDLVGYRRWGHNEGDEPRYTQPDMYQLVDKTPTVRAKWAAEMERRGLIKASKIQAMIDHQNEKMQEGLEAAPAVAAPGFVEVPPKGAAESAKTAVSADKLKTYHDALLAVPDGFMLHNKLKRVLKRRITMLDDPANKAIDWGTAESLAFASILADGTAIRLTGEDVERGTFSHRHALWRDADTAKVHAPLQEFPQANASFEVRNSPLTENAAIGYEYGYNIQAPERLSVWEAQFGDFINGAQTMIDEFLSSGRAKWGQTPSLVLLLPHGFEGQGPDHSSARLERFLQLAGEMNMRIANPTTSAQYFHLIRRQAAVLEIDPLPLIIMSPKSLLRHPLAASSLEELANGRFKAIIDDYKFSDTPEAVTRLVICSGKVYTDLENSDERKANDAVAVVRMEQIYPWPGKHLQPIIARYPNLQEVCWLQEEPLNMGAWDYVRPRIERMLGDTLPLNYIGRPRRASPAEGSTTWHKINQKSLIEKAFKA